MTRITVVQHTRPAWPSATTPTHPFERHFVRAWATSATCEARTWSATHAHVTCEARTRNMNSHDSTTSRLYTAVVCTAVACTVGYGMHTCSESQRGHPPRPPPTHSNATSCERWRRRRQLRAKCERGQPEGSRATQNTRSSSAARRHKRGGVAKANAH